MTSSTADLGLQIRNFLEIKINGVVPPMTLKRRTSQQIADALNQPEEKVRERLKAMIQKTASFRENPRAHAYFVREHHDGRYSYSGKSPFEELLVPDPYELEKLINDKDFATLDARLADIGMRRPKAAEEAPDLAWVDGTTFSTGASDWYYAQLLAKTFYFHLKPSHAKKPVREAHDLLRHALDDASAGELVRWVLKTPHLKHVRAQIPRHPAAFKEIVKSYLKPGKKLPGFAQDCMLTAGPLGCRWLLRYGVIGAQHRTNYVHDVWPQGDDVTGTAEQWRQRMQKFLGQAVQLSTHFSRATLEANYLSNPLMRALLKDALFQRQLSVHDAEGIIQTTEEEWTLDASTGRLTRANTSHDDTKAIESTPDTLRILRLNRDQDAATSSSPRALPELPSAPMSVAEYNRRCELAGLAHAESYTGKNESYALDPEGKFTLYWKTCAKQSRRRDPVQIVRLKLDQRGPRPNACLGEDPFGKEPTCYGWDSLDPVWRRMVDERMKILLSPAPLSLPKLTEKDGDVSVGSRVEITRGKSKGVTGEVFWFGPSKFGDGDRAGVKDASGEKHWVDASRLKPAGGGWTPLHAACDAYDFELVAAILDASKTWVNTSTAAEGSRKSHYHKHLFYPGRSTPLHIAAKQQAVEPISFLLDAGADPNLQDANDDTPLHLVGDAPDIIKLLLDAGAKAKL